MNMIFASNQIEGDGRMAKKVVIALGGNAILQPKQEATYENKLENVQKSAKIVAQIIQNGHKVIVTHGNGPQVGHILRQNEVARDIVPPLPLHVCSAESQGFIGYMMDQMLKNELAKLGLERSEERRVGKEWKGEWWT